MIIEEAILNDLKDALETIRTTNEYASGKNYLTNIGADIYLWGKAKDAKPGFPITELMDEDGFHNEEESDSGSDANAMKILIKVAAEENTNTASLLRKARTDIIRCIGANRSAFKTKFGGYFEINLGDWEIEVEKESNKTSGVLQMDMLCQYETSRYMLADADVFYTVISQSDFSAGVDGYESDDLLTGNNDAVSDGSTSENDVLKLEIENHLEISHQIIQSINGFAAGTYRISFKYLLPSTNTAIEKIGVYPSNFLSTITGNSVGTVKDTWSALSIIITSDEIWGVGFYSFDAANEQNFDGFGDSFYIKDIIVEEVQQ